MTHLAATVAWWPPDWPALIAAHGYWLLALGALLEGETLLLLAGWAAHQGLLSLPLVVLVAATAGFTGDMLFFWLGRTHGPALKQRYPALARRAADVDRLIARHHEWLIVGVRFAYGLRVVGPVLIGAAGITPLRFAAFNALGAALWAMLVSAAGWLFGHAIERLFGAAQRFELALLAALLAGVAAWWWHRRRPR